MKLKINEKKKIKNPIYIFFLFLLLTQEIRSGASRFNIRKSYDDQEKPDDNQIETYLEVPDESINGDEEEEEFVKKEDRINTSDMILQRIKGHIRSMAYRQMKSNIQIKKRLNGILSEEYPQSMIDKAYLIRNNKDLWNKILLYPTEVWRHCIYPNFNLNYIKFCDQSYGLVNEYKLKSCKYNFCIVCCDQLKFHLYNTSEKSLIGHLLELSGKKGYHIMNSIIDQNEIKSCRNSCQVKFFLNKIEYKLEMPKIYPIPPRDEKLGKDIYNSAHSCSDIKKWGAEDARSGTYWTKIGNKGYRQVYCDMQTDGGGWTLFFNYIHYPETEFLLNSQKLPENYKVNSHMYLKNAGYSESDVKEIRFFCMEKSMKKRLFVNFKNKSSGTIDTALTGDQLNMNLNQFKSSYEDLEKPSDLKNYERSFDSRYLDELNFIGKETNGGFSSTLFGTPTQFWSVRGGNKNAPRFECGTKHESVGGFTSPGFNSGLIYTKHSIYFRGEPVSEDDARARYMSKIKN